MKKKSLSSEGTTVSRSKSLVDTSPAAMDALVESLSKRIGREIKRKIPNAKMSLLADAAETGKALEALASLVSARSRRASGQDPLEAARSRLAKRLASLASLEGGALTLAEAAERLSKSSAAVNELCIAGLLIAWVDEQNVPHLPRWQFDSSGIVPGLPEALESLQVSDPWMRMQFFLNYDDALGDRPLNALRRGQAAEVKKAASRFGMFGDDRHRSPRT